MRKFKKKKNPRKKKHPTIQTHKGEKIENLILSSIKQYQLHWKKISSSVFLFLIFEKLRTVTKVKLFMHILNQLCANMFYNCWITAHLYLLPLTVSISTCPPTDCTWHGNSIGRILEYFKSEMGFINMWKESCSKQN